MTKTEFMTRLYAIYNRGNYDGSLKLDLSRLKDIQTSNLQSNSLQGTVSGEVGSTWGELYQQVRIQ